MASNRKDICVIGTGKFGTAVIEQLVDLKRHVLALDILEANLIKVSRITNTAIVDAADIESLKAIGVHLFDTVIVAATDNIEIVAALIELGIKHVIAKAKSQRHERVLRQIGVDVIVRPEAEAGIRTALIATNANFIKYSELLQEVGDGYAIGSTAINNGSWVNKPLSELAFKNWKISVVSIARESKVILPEGGVNLKEGDIITLIGKIPHITKIFGELNGDGATKIVQLNKMRRAEIEASAKRHKKLKINRKNKD